MAPLGRAAVLATQVGRWGKTSWVAKQISAALVKCRGMRLLVHDNDSLYSGAFLDALRDLGVRSLPITKRAPWMNGHVERLIGTLRRECTDHLLVFDEEHLRCALTEFVDYYNGARPHTSLGCNSPTPRWSAGARDGPVIGRPVLGGLHHVYRRAGDAGDVFEPDRAKRWAEGLSTSKEHQRDRSAPTGPAPRREAAGEELGPVWGIPWADSTQLANLTQLR